MRYLSCSLVFGKGVGVVQGVILSVRSALLSDFRHTAPGGIYPVHCGQFLPISAASAIVNVVGSSLELREWCRIGDPIRSSIASILTNI